MNIWELKAAPKYTTLVPADKEKDLVLFMDHFCGNSMSDWWRSIPLEIYKKGENRDSYYLTGGIPIFTLETLRKIGPFMRGYAEFLPALCNNEEIYLVNVFKGLNVVDYNASIIKRRPSGSFSDFVKLEFNAAEVNKYPIFKIEEFAETRVYVNDEFIDLVKTYGVQSFDFVKVWTSDEPSEAEIALQKKYNAIIKETESYRGPTYKWDDAIQLVHSGKAVRSGEWMMQEGENGELLISVLRPDCEYYVLNSPVIPPAILFLEWHETESKVSRANIF